MKKYHKLWVTSTLFVAVLLVLIQAYALAATVDKEADIVVVGGGSAGLAAAVSATQNGAKVILVEKQPVLGGASAFAEGLFGIGTDEQRRAAIYMTTDEVFKYMVEFSHGLADGPLLRTAIEESGATIAWLKRDLGVQFELAKLSPSEPMVFHLPNYKGKHLGASLIAAYVDKAKELGITVLTRTTGKKLLVEKGKIIGLEAIDTQGKPFAIKAKAVIIATGGFNNSKEHIAKWTHFDPERTTPFVPLNKVGEGIEMAIAQGADTKGFGLMVFPFLPAGQGIQPFGPVMTAATQAGLWVNAAGERFVDEAIQFNFPLAANAIYGQRGSFAWSIWDEDQARHLKEDGIDISQGMFLRAGTKIDAFAEMTAAVAAGNKNVAMADSVPELAKKMGVDPVRLQKAIERYNGFAATNRDTEFFKEPRWLRPVKNGKLMAARLIAGHFISIGGARVTPRLEVITPMGATIPGLYAAGSDVGGLWGDTYGVWTTGAMMSWASTSGRLAGVSAAAFAKTAK